MTQDFFPRYRSIVDNWTDFQAAVQRPLPTVIWANSLRIAPDALPDLLPFPTEPVHWYSGAYRIPDGIKAGLRWEYMAGLYHVQEEVSLLPVTLLNVQPGQRILDLCAAPGGKTVQMGTMMGNSGTVIANDRSTGRIKAAGQSIQRLGLINVTTTTYDGANYPRAAGQFDRVLVDVPCSAEGTCRKDMKARRGASQRDWNKLGNTQRALLQKAVQLCRPGGRIVYATCTFAPEENELIVDDILRQFGEGEVRLLPAKIDDFVTMPGITEWNGRCLDPSLAQTMRVWPHHNDTGGFFVAVLEKQAGGVDPDAPLILPEAEDGAAWLNWLKDRFGMDMAQFADKRIVLGGSKNAYVGNQDQQPPIAPKLDAFGLPFVRLGGRDPKLTSAAAMAFGQSATRNVLDLEPAQAADFLGRRDVVVTAVQTQQAIQSGYVLLRYRGYVLGVGLYRQTEGTIESHFPKGWSRSNAIVD